MDNLAHSEIKPNQSAKSNLSRQFSLALLNGAILNPLDAVNQLINKTTGSKLNDKLAYNLKPAKFNTFSWYAQTAGSSIGALLPLIVTGKAITLGKEIDLTATTSDYAYLNNTGALGLNLKESALTGFTYGSLLTPGNDKQSLTDFLQQRLNTGISSGLMFSTMTAGSIGLSKLATEPELNSTLFGKILSKNTANSLLASVPASVIGTESNSLLNSGKLAGSKELFQQAYSMSLISLGFGLSNDLGVFKVNAIKRLDQPVNNSQLVFDPFKAYALKPPIDPSLSSFDANAFLRAVHSLKAGSSLESQKNAQLSALAQPKVIDEHNLLSGMDIAKMITSNNQQLVFTNLFEDNVYLKDPDSTDSRLIYPGQSIDINPHGKLTLGSIDGPNIPILTKQILAIPEVYINGKPIFLNDSSKIIGSKLFNSSEKDILDLMVSPEHGKLTYSNIHQKFIYTDTSLNGTFIRDENYQWTHLKHGNSMILSPDDEVYLGSKTGPKLNLKITDGYHQDNGSILFRRANSDLIYHPSGKIEYITDSGTGYETNNKGLIIRAFGPNNMEINYQYNSLWKLTEAKINHNNNYQIIFKSKDGVNYTARIMHAQNLGNSTAQPVEGLIKVAKDGSLILESNNGDKLIQRLDGSEEKIYKNGFTDVKKANLDTQTAILEALVATKFGDIDQQSRFHDLMNNFIEFGQEKQLSNNEIAVTLHHVNRLLASGSEGYLSDPIRSRLAEQVLFNAAFPKTIDQGNNKTCNVTTIETRLYERSPQLAAKLIADAAIYCKTITFDGKVIDIGRSGGLDPDQESLDVLGNGFDSSPDSLPYQDIKIDGIRNFANQIFQNAAVNIYYNIFPLAQAKPGDIVQYSKTVPDPTRPNDTGEKLQIYSLNANHKLELKTIQDSPYIDSHRLVDLYNHLVPAFDNYDQPHPGQDKGFVVVGKNVAPLIVDSLKDGSVSYTNESRHFEKFLQYAKEKQMFPLIASIDTSVDEGIFGPYRGGHKFHVIVLHDIKADSPGQDSNLKVEFTNQWGSKFNHMGNKAVLAKDLFKSIY